MEDEEKDDAYLPSLEEIEEKCDLIRSSWSASKEKSRRVFEVEDLIVRHINTRDISLE